MSNDLKSTKIRNAHRRFRQGRITWDKLKALLTRYKTEITANTNV